MATTYETKEAWEVEGARLFGDDRTAWRFVCPQRKRVQSIQSLRAELSALELAVARECKYSIEQECIGRAISRLGCDWAAYGLFCGPVFVGPDKMPIFDFDRASEVVEVVTETNRNRHHDVKPDNGDAAPPENCE
jgi:hypothetical protein